MAATTVVPNGDGTLNSWSGTYTSIDEGVATYNDSDLVTTTAQNQSCFFLLQDMPADFGTATAVTIKIRCKRSTSKGDYISFGPIQLVQSDEATAITATSEIGESTTMTTLEYSPSITGGTSKTTWDGARVKVTASSGTSGTLSISCIDVVITYTPAVTGNPWYHNAQN